MRHNAGHSRRYLQYRSSLKNHVLKIARNCNVFFFYFVWFVSLIKLQINFENLAIEPLNVFNFRMRLLIIDHSARKRQGIFLFFFANIDSRCICYNVTVRSVLAPVIQDRRNWEAPLPIFCQQKQEWTNFQYSSN